MVEEDMSNMNFQVSQDERPLARKVFSLQVRIVGKLNDVHIFIQQAVPLLEAGRSKFEVSTHKKNRRYYVPVVGRTKFARRKDKEVKAIYDRFITRELYENLIVTAVSQFESFVFDVLRLIITEYPQKLTLSIKGVETNREVPLEVLLRSDNLKDVINEVIDKRLNTISYAPPKAYLEYLSHIVGVETTDPAFLNFIEIKATRDLIVHNSCIINEVYLSKVGDRKRGEIGETVIIDASYFDHCIATLKRVSGIIKREVEKNFPVHTDGS